MVSLARTHQSSENLPNPSHNFSSLAFSIQLLLSRPLASVSPATAALVSVQGKLTYDSTSSSASARQLKWFNIGEGCLVFEGLFEFYQASVDGSIGATVKINRKDADIAINWAGGLHHTKKCEASDFCYVNDIVLDILEFLKYHRVSRLYISFCYSSIIDFVLASLKAISFILCSHRSSIDMRTFSQGDDELFVSLVVAPDICGKNGFIGVAYLTIGSLCIFLVVAFMVLYLLKPGTLGDPSYLSWNTNPDGH
ncbi:hypothetical protein ZIOFF_070456 [Zingiber officinale]|uniref:Histone deacetylase domain-containing protein n=1 Tax=Zingiber officinale TaxID=94328 RepID=A0A8J5CWR3_ZINOF|nr:hypothetical protein ZIOFF_070456 [Zingiber officinale]